MRWRFRQRLDESMGSNYRLAASTTRQLRQRTQFRARPLPGIYGGSGKGSDAGTYRLDLYARPRRGRCRPRSTAFRRSATMAKCLGWRGRTAFRDSEWGRNLNRHLALHALPSVRIGPIFPACFPTSLAIRPRVSIVRVTGRPICQLTFRDRSVDKAIRARFLTCR